MPISDKQLAANRANAAKSSGPKTKQGKLISARNGARKSPLSVLVLVDGESASVFSDLIRSFETEFHVQTHCEQAFVESMAVAKWNQYRIWSLKSGEINRAIRSQPNIGPDGFPLNNQARFSDAVRTAACNSTYLDSLGREEARYERQFHRSLRSLLRFRTEKRFLLQQTHQPVQDKGQAE